MGVCCSKTSEIEEFELKRLIILEDLNYLENEIKNYKEILRDGGDFDSMRMSINKSKEFAYFFKKINRSVQEIICLFEEQQLSDDYRKDFEYKNNQVKEIKEKFHIIKTMLLAKDNSISETI